MESSTVLKFYVQYWRDYFRRLDTLGLGPSTRLVQLWTRYVELDLSGQSEWLEINCEIFRRVLLESTYALTQSEVLHSWRFEPWSNIYLDLGIRCGFPLAVLRRFPHLHIHCIVQNYVWFFPVLDWFSIQLGLVLKLIILDLATGRSLLLSQDFAASIARLIRAWISRWNLSSLS